MSVSVLLAILAELFHGGPALFAPVTFAELPITETIVLEAEAPHGGAPFDDWSATERVFRFGARP